MKKTILLLLVVVVTTAPAVFAKKITVKVSNFQFSPATVNASLGDTIIWKWVNGTHTTSSLTIPVGAKAWNKPIDSSHKTFKYRLTKSGVYNYQCNIHATIMKGTINVSAASAAGIAEFTVGEKEGSAILTWRAASLSSSYFSVERSTDASQFTEIARVNTNETNLYTFRDNSLPSAKFVYYQLSTTDPDGNKLLSPIQMFANKRSTSTSLITSLSPNPVSGSGHLMIQFTADRDGVLLARLYNQSGSLLKQEELTALKGLNNGHFALGNLSPGSYYIIFSTGSISEKHIVVVK